MRLVFTPHGEDYSYWQRTDRATLRRVNRLLDDALRDPFSGIGKPEPLRHALAGCWSRRIDDEHGSSTRSTATTSSCCRPATTTADHSHPHAPRSPLPLQPDVRAVELGR